MRNSWCLCPFGCIPRSLLHEQGAYLVQLTSLPQEISGSPESKFIFPQGPLQRIPFSILISPGELQFRICEERRFSGARQTKAEADQYLLRLHADQANPSNSLRISTRLICFIIFSFTCEESGLKNCKPIPVSPALADLFTQTTTVMTSVW